MIYKTRHTIPMYHIKSCEKYQLCTPFCTYSALQAAAGCTRLPQAPARSIVASLFNILNLLPHVFNFRFELEHHVRYLQIISL